MSIPQTDFHGRPVDLFGIAHAPCGGTGLVEGAACQQRIGRIQVSCTVAHFKDCPGPHAGPFDIDGQVVYADPAKVIYLSNFAYTPDGFYPIGERLTEAD